MLAWLSLAAFAQEAPPIDAQLFHPSIGSHRMTWVDEVGTTSGAPFHSNFLLHYVRHPLSHAVDDVLQLDSTLGIHAGRFGVGIDVPVFLYARGEENEGSALGDINVDGKIVLFDREKAPLGVGVGGRVWFPTATTELPLGTEEPEWEVQVSAEQEAGHLLVVGDVGFATGPEVEYDETELGDFVVAKLGGSWALGEHDGLSLETAARFMTTAPVASRGTSVQWLGSAYAGIGDGVVLRVGGGTGIGRGIGSPDFRAMVGIGWAPEHGEAHEVEHVAEHEPACPEEGEPPGALVDVWVVDADHARVGSASVRMDDLADPCGHGLAIEQEVVLAFRAPVVLDGDHVTTRDTVKFATGSATIRPESWPTLDAVAELVGNSPEIARLRVEGHTDARGAESSNLTLSRARAESVRRYLVTHGLSEDRVTSDGFGETRPLDPGEGPAAWEVNRRVELVVERSQMASVDLRE